MAHYDPFKVIAAMLRERKLLDVIYAGYRGQGGEIGRRARLRITKSSISKRSFSFQKTIDLREKNAIFHDQHRVYDWRVKTSSL